jgi:hypothetical protein
MRWRLGNYQTEITNRFATFENLSADEDITRAWDSTKRI